MIIKDHIKEFAIGMLKPSILAYSEEGKISGDELPSNIDKESLYSLIVGLVLQGALNITMVAPEQIIFIDMGEFYIIETVIDPNSISTEMNQFYHILVANDSIASSGALEDYYHIKTVRYSSSYAYELAGLYNIQINTKEGS